MLVVIGLSVAGYAVATLDSSSAFGLGSFLVALFTVYLTYQYFAWKEDVYPVRILSFIGSPYPHQIQNISISHKR